MTPPKLLDGRLKIRHLKLATTIADMGTIVAAAEQLSVTQPVVTRGLQELETILGVPLFKRSARGVNPTPAGQAFIQHARNVITQLQAAAEDVSDITGGKSGRVTIGTYLAGSLLLPHAIDSYHQERPGVVIIIREATPSELNVALLAGDIDLIVGRLAPTPNTDQLIQIPLYRNPIRLVVGKKHELADRANVTLRDLVDYPWILPDQQTSLRQEIDQVFVNGGIPIPPHRVECTSFLIVKSLLVRSRYVAALPYMLTAPDPELSVLDTELPGVSRTVGVTRRRQTVLTAHCQEFLQHIEWAAVKSQDVV